MCRPEKSVLRPDSLSFPVDSYDLNLEVTKSRLAKLKFRRLYRVTKIHKFMICSSQDS